MTDALRATFSALADPTRRSILAQLAKGEATVNELAAPHAMSLPSVSRHLKVLEKAGLGSKGRSAQWRPCRLEVAPLRAADEWMAPYRRFFESRFDRLEEQLKEMAPGQERGASRTAAAQRRHGEDRTSKEETTMTDSERGFTLTRMLDAPRERVFQAWTDPWHLQWFYSDLVDPREPIEVDLRVGGVWRQKMIVDENTEYFTGGIYHEIVPPERVVFTWGA